MGLSVSSSEESLPNPPMNLAMSKHISAPLSMTGSKAIGKENPMINEVLGRLIKKESPNVNTAKGSMLSIPEHRVDCKSLREGSNKDIPVSS